MKTLWKARLCLPDPIAINGKLYKPSVKPLSVDMLGNAKGIEKQIVLEEVESEDEDLKPKP